jgi:UDP-N-acetylglucosamine--N-acetylmuramyl-(pentapeptide) pyrophosphoryl-undecaprenol N-acetylglucosamine transferase
MNVVIACGGTGGHLFPGLAVAEVLRQRGHEVMVFISEKEIDALAVRDHVGQFRFEKLPSIGLPRVFSPAMLGFARGFVESVARCRRLYREFRPDAVLGMGGFTSTAPIVAGRLAKAATYIHESNAIPGKANRLNARLAQVVLVGFEECAQRFRPGTRCVFTGTPIRASLRSAPSREEALASFGLQEGAVKKTLLIMGGSQGAHGINQAALQALPEWRSALQIIHFTGRDDEQTVREAYEREGVAAYVAAFHHRMQDAYAAANFAIARSGAASLSELAAFGLPSLLIPYPYAAEDHQTFNAQIFTRAGAALSLKESETNGEYLSKIVLEVLKNPPKLAQMTAEARRLCPPDAATLLAETLERKG